MIVILGGGGHSKVLIEALRYRADSALDRISVMNFHTDFDSLERTIPKDTFLKLVNGVGLMDARKIVYAYAKSKPYRNQSVIHPSAVISSDGDSIFGDGLQAMAGAVIQPGCKIGHNVLVNTGAQIDHDCIIGDHCHIAPGAILCGGVTVGEGAFIGAGAVIPEGRKIPDNAFVPAGTVFK